MFFSVHSAGWIARSIAAFSALMRRRRNPIREQDVVALHADEPGLAVRRRHRVPVADVHVPDGYGNIVTK